MFWEGRITKRQIASMLSFRQMGFEVNFWSYQDYDIPNGIIKRDASSLLAKDALDKYTFSHAFRSKKNGKEEAKYTAMSDVIRFRILASEDGWWSDCDVICLRPPEDFNDLYSSKDNICIGFVWRSEINTAVMAFPNKEIASMIDQENKKVMASQNHINLGDLNLPTINKVIERENLAHEILPANFFYPSTDAMEIFWSSNDQDIDALRDLSTNSYTVHWSNSFTHKYLREDGTQIPGFIEQLFATLPQEELAAYSY